MTKEEKEKLKKSIWDNRIPCPDILSTDMYNQALKHAIEEVENMPIAEPKETNLEHYKDEIKDNIIHCHNNCYLVYTLVNNLLTLMGAKLSADTEKNIDKLLKLLLQTYEKPKYRVTQFEYDLLETYNTENMTFTNYQIKNLMCLKRMKEKGYFKSIDEDTEVKEILENCGVVNEQD